MVVIDTLRQDRVGAYGYALPTTPALDALAARGTRFSEARSTSSWTAPGHASLFTGLYPAAHGTTQERWELDEGQDTLAEILHAQGYRTLAAVANPMVSRARGFAQGFDEFREGWRTRSLAFFTLDDSVAHWVGGRMRERDERPQLVFVNLIGVHSPYDSCGTSCGAFGAGVDAGPVDNDWRDVYRGRRTHDPASLARLGHLYDAEVHKADAVLERLLRAFDEAAGERPRLVVVTSDHGENLGEHGHVDHVFSLYEPTVRIPLVVTGDGFAAGAVDPSPVQILDVFPTVLEAAGVPLAAHPSQGLPLKAVPDDRPVLLEYYRPVQATDTLLRDATDEERARVAPFLRRLRAVVEGGDKLIWGSDGTRELYALTVDPAEQEDLSSTAPERVERLVTVLGERLSEVERERPSGATSDVDAATRAALEALGYVE